MFRILSVGDIHCGSILGLTPPHAMDSENSQWLGPLYKFWADICEQVGDVDALVINGDIIDGPGKKDPKLQLTTDVKKQLDYASELLEMIKVPSNRRYLAKGSGYHVDGDASYEEFVADAFGIRAEPAVRLEAHGRLFHFRHHVGRSDTPYGQYTQVGKELINEMLQAELEGYRSADVLGRSHVHYCVIAGFYDAARGVMRYGYTSPGMQLRGPIESAFVLRLRTWMYHVGVTLIETDKRGEVFIRPIVMPIKTYMQRGYVCLTEKS